MPTEKTRKSVMYDMKIGKKEKEFDIVEEYEIYLVNDSEYPIEKVEMLVGGFAGEDDGIMETSKNVKDFGRLDSKKALLLETLDFGMLDFMNWYYLDLHLNNKECLKIDFSFNGWKVGKDTYQDIPILNRKGSPVAFDLRTTDIIKNVIKDLDMNSKFTKTSND